MKRIAFQSLFAAMLCLILTSCDSGSGEDGEVIVTDLVEGTGTEIQAGHTLIVTYIGRFQGGEVFATSDDLGGEFIFTLGVGQVLKGWDDALGGMKVGGTRRLEIPSYKAFGKSGQCFSDGTCAVPPNTDVVYDVTVIDIFDEVIIEDLIEGDGLEAEFSDVLFVEYVGLLRDGSVFDATAIGGAEFVFTLGNGSVIQGWELGLVGMKEGGKRKLTIPPVLGYGGQGIGSAIPPFSILIFEIELNQVIKNPN